MRLILSITILLTISCSSADKKISPDLQKAAYIQHEALVIVSELQNIISELPDSLSEVMEGKRNALRNQMIDIPQIPHDHKYCNGKHASLKVNVSDAEMLNIQGEWRDSIKALDTRVRAFIR